MTAKNSPLSILSMVFSLLSAAFLLWFVLDPLDQRWAYFAMGITAFIGAITGFISRRNGAHITNAIGLYLGLALLVIFVLLFFYLSSTRVETTPVQ
jgi:uncharacterized membrane protein